MPTYHHGELRQAVLQAAGEILEKEGLEALRAGGPARRAGAGGVASGRGDPGEGGARGARCEGAGAPGGGLAQRAVSPLSGPGEPARGARGGGVRDAGWRAPEPATARDG